MSIDLKNLLIRYWRDISQWFMLGVMIFVIFQFLVGRVWCYQLVQPYFDNIAKNYGVKNQINSSNFDSFIRFTLENRSLLNDSKDICAVAQNLGCFQ